MLTLLLISLLFVPILAHPAHATNLPPGFIEEEIASGITAATAFTLSPDGRIFICEQTGDILVWKDGNRLAQPLLSLPVEAYWERGLVGIALHPDFPDTPWLYLTYVEAQPFARHVVSRFRVEGDRALPETEEVFLRGDDQDAYGGFKPSGHQGGPMRFGPDGKLYIGLGEQTARWPSQAMDSLSGKVLRLNPDGSIPTDNPFYHQLDGKYRSIYATGIRNPFGLAFRPSTGQLFLNDVGQTAFEEIDVIVAGGNYGWPEEEGLGASGEFIDPIYAYPPALGQSITGGVFYEGPSLPFPERYHGLYFFLDYMANWIMTLDPDQPNRAETFATGLSGPLDLQLGPDGSLYCLNRNAWVLDDRLQPETGSLVRIRYVGEAAAAEWAAKQAAPATTQPTSPYATPELELSLPSGRYTGSITVTLQSAYADRPDIALRYTLDGSLPNRWSPLFDRPITIDSDTTLVAAAIESHKTVLQSTRAHYRFAGQQPYGLPARPPPPSLGLPADTADWPGRLSELISLHNPDAFQPSPAFVPYDVISPIWEPHVRLRRWMALPTEGRIQFSEQGLWQLPPGSVLLQHFQIGPRPLETRLILVGSNDCHQAASYRWNAQGTEATLSRETFLEDISALAGLPANTRTWLFPAPDNCLSFHNPRALYRHQLSSLQMNRDFHYEATRITDNQLRAWNHAGLFHRRLDEQVLASLPALTPLDDATATLESRARSYLHSNCSACHQPSGNVRSELDLRLQTSLSNQGLVRGKALTALPDFPGSLIIDPGHPERSILHHRITHLDPATRMPPLSFYQEPSPAVSVIANWIRELGQRPAKVKLTRDATDDSAGGLPCFKIETPTATYFLEKQGGGLSSMLDRDGVDWLAFHPQEGSGAAGEYRGFPNAVYKEAGNYFHALNSGTDPCIATVEEEGADWVSISVVSEQGHWAGRYDFYADHATFTMTRMPADHHYWILYEGVPGGSYQDSDWWMTSSVDTPQPLTQNHEGDIPAPEWIAFGDPASPRSLLLLSHTDDHHPDRFYQMQRKMTVFGFGRQGINRLLDSVPRSFSIAFIESTDHPSLTQAAHRLLQSEPPSP